MKSEFKGMKEEKITVYPWLGLNPIGEYIVLFTKPCTGTVIWSRNEEIKVGYTVDSWHTRYFTEVHGEVTLSQ